MSEKDGKNDKNWWQPVFILFFKWSVWIVVPILLGAFWGKWLDGHYGTEPFLFLVCTAVAFLVSIGYLIREASREYRKLDNPVEKTTSPDQEREIKE